LIYITLAPLVEGLPQNATWVIAESGETQIQACTRINLAPLYMGDIDLVWNTSSLQSVVNLLNRKSYSENGGLDGCCAPGLWCDDETCFTQGFGNFFSNYGWLNNNTVAHPVYTCLTGGASSGETVIGKATLKGGTLTVDGQGFSSTYDDSAAFVYNEACVDIETCNCMSCSNSADSCPAGYLCLSHYDMSSYCFLECAGDGDESCPCGHTCSVVFGGGSDALYLCIPPNYSSYDSTCSQHTDHLTCRAPRAYQEVYQLESQSNSNKLEVSLTINNEGDLFDQGSAPDLSTGFCSSNADCLDGNLCTVDSCDTTTKLCAYTSVPGCDSMVSTITTRNTPFMYYSYYAANQAIAGVQASSVTYLLNAGTTSSVQHEDDIPLQQLDLPFQITFFGNVVDQVYLSPNGLLALPPVRPCQGDQCFLIASSSNVISPFYTDWDPTESSTARVVYFTQTSASSSIWGVQGNAFHVLYYNSVRFHKNGVNTGLGIGLNTFAASVYSDGSIRLSFVDITTKLKVSDFIGIWGSFASSYNGGDTNLRYHLEALDASEVVSGSEVLYCPVSSIACPTETCLLPNDTLTARWDGTTSCGALGSSYEFHVTCSFAGGLAISESTLSTDGSYKTVSCEIPTIPELSDGAIISVEIVVTAVLLSGNDTPYSVNAKDAPGTKSVYGAYLGKNGEVARSSMMISYFQNSTNRPLGGCGCNPLTSYYGSQCDDLGVCGGTNSTGDCAGVSFGSAVTTSCNSECVGGTTGLSPQYSCGGESNSNSNIISQTIILLMVICCMTFMTMSVTYSLRRMMALRAMRDDLDRFNEQLVMAENEVMRRRRLGLGPGPRGLTEFECEALGQITFTKEFYEKHKKEQAEHLHGKDSNSKVPSAKEGEVVSSAASTAASPEPVIAGDVATTAPSTTEDADQCECTICLMEIEEGNICRALPAPCGHIFHVACIDEWFQQSFLCPLCKRSIRAILMGSDSDPTPGGGGGVDEEAGGGNGGMYEDIVFIRPNLAIRFSTIGASSVARPNTRVRFDMSRINIGGGSNNASSVASTAPAAELPYPQEVTRASSPTVHAAGSGIIGQNNNTDNSNDNNNSSSSTSRADDGVELPTIRYARQLRLQRYQAQAGNRQFSPSRTAPQHVTFSTEHTSSDEPPYDTDLAPVLTSGSTHSATDRAHIRFQELPRDNDSTDSGSP